METEDAISRDLAALEEGALDLAQFPHREHLRLAFHMLSRHAFGEAVARFSGALKLLTAKFGKPEAYHETMTGAYLALIAERRARRDTSTWEEFISANPDLLEKDCLSRSYTADELQSEIARTTFILPRR
ncbi:MAG: hypothetical protein ABR526_05785 [Chthoniobacterales bacterium]